MIRNYKLWTGLHAPDKLSRNIPFGLSKYGPRPRDWQTRLWEKVDRREAHECWEWIGYKNKHGYGEMMVGTLNVNRRFHKAHRLAYVSAFGEIPAGMVVRHKCDNPSCCNPDHLEIGLPGDNIHDAVERGGLNQGTKNGHSKFTDECYDFTW